MFFMANVLVFSRRRKFVSIPACGTPLPDT
jgi:hypothetical protein